MQTLLYLQSGVGSVWADIELTKANASDSAKNNTNLFLMRAL